VIPGPRSRELLAIVRRHEARGVTYVADDYPIVWGSANGATVTDVDGNTYTDLTSAFGVANVGHANARVVAAVSTQAARLVHGMGDVHPPETKVRLLARLAGVAPSGLERVFLASTGAETIEFALKTAYLATGRPRAIAFEGAYHGLSLGALEVGGIDRFRRPFAPLVAERTTYLPFPGSREPLDAALDVLRAALRNDPAIGAVVLEPIQGRGGVIVPPDGYLAGVRDACHEAGAVMILDEIYTGFARTGTFFACDRERVVPDLMCVGKAIAGGVPLSATLGSAAIMDAWPVSEGEALHTSTYLGNPLACAAALAVIDEIEERDLCARARVLEALLGDPLRAFADDGLVDEARGRGALWAIEFGDAARANRIVRRALGAGIILLQSGTDGTSVTLAPPLVIDDDLLADALARLRAILISEVIA